jgi:hypothetical protein
MHRGFTVFGSGKRAANSLSVLGEVSALKYPSQFSVCLVLADGEALVGGAFVDDAGV